MEQLSNVFTWLLDNKEAIIPVIFSVIGAATSISKFTPNETDNKIVLAISKIIQIFAIHAKPTQIKKPTPADIMKVTGFKYDNDSEGDS